SGLEPLGPRDLPRHLVEGARDGRGGEPWRGEAPAQCALRDPPDARVAAEPGVLRRSGRGGRDLRHPGGDRRGHGARPREPRSDRVGKPPAGAHPERHLRHRGRRAWRAPDQRRHGLGRARGCLSGASRVGGTLRVVGKVLRRLRPYRWAFTVAIIQVLLIGLHELAKPWPLKVVVDNVLGGRELGIAALAGLPGRQLLLVACGALVAVYALLGALGVTSNYATISVGQRMVNDFRSELYAHLARLSLAFHSRRQVGDLL